MGPAGGPGQDYVNRFVRSRQVLLYLGQNDPSGMAKRKPAFRELEPVLRDAARRGSGPHPPRIQLGRGR